MHHISIVNFVLVQKTEEESPMEGLNPTRAIEEGEVSRDAQEGLSEEDTTIECK